MIFFLLAAPILVPFFFANWRFGIAGLAVRVQQYDMYQYVFQCIILLRVRIVIIIIFIINAPNRFVTPPSDIFFSDVPRSSPTISFFTWRLTSARHCRQCALRPLNPASTYRDDGGISCYVQLTVVRKLAPRAPACPDKPGGRAARLLHDGPTRFVVPLHMRLWTMHAYHGNASCHLSVSLAFIVPVVLACSLVPFAYLYVRTCC